MSHREAYQPRQITADKETSEASNARASKESTPTPVTNTSNTSNNNSSSSSSGSGTTTAGPANTAGTNNPQPTVVSRGARAEYATPDRRMHYRCGDCGKKSGFAANDPIRCLKCGCRAMFKLSTTRVTQFEAI
ncbi:hypothetical protein VTK56DRAFT_2869 [Thermocarpiscus australiensis]